MRILVATDRSVTASRAVEWAAGMAERYEAELLLLQVVAPENLVGAAQADGDRAAALSALATQVAGARGRARLVFDSDPAAAIVRAAAEDAVDVVVVGNLNMQDRTEFLLNSVANRVSHNARCTVVIVNTAGVLPDGAKPTSAAPHAAAQPEEPHLTRRAAHIARVMTRIAYTRMRSRGRSRGSEAKQFRDGLEELGPTFAKLGQILSTRPDLLPPDFIAELATLQDKVTPLSESDVVAAMERELQVPWEDVFTSIEADPMAAGTIAQVHRAVLATGERVVVKVQRPNAERDIAQDLELLEIFVDKAAERPAFTQVVDLPAIVAHLASSLRLELDFREEASNLERMREVLGPYPRLDVPAVHGDISTARLLVMEEVQGIPLTQAPAGDARKEAARQMLESYYAQVLDAGFFHADPHPGNLKWWNDRIYFLDLGMVGRVDAEGREDLLLMLLAFWQEDAAFLTELLLTMSGGGAAGDVDEDALQAELSDLVGRCRHLSLSELRLGPLMQEMTSIALRHNVRLPANMALTAKAFGQMQLATAQLDPELDPFTAAGAFFFKRVRTQMRGALRPQRFFYEAQKARRRVNQVMRVVDRLGGAGPGARLQLELAGAAEMERAVWRAGRRVALAMVASVSLLAAVLSAATAHVGGWVTALLACLGAVLLVALLADLTLRRW